MEYCYWGFKTCRKELYFTSMVSVFLACDFTER